MIDGTRAPRFDADVAHHRRPHRRRRRSRRPTRARADDRRRGPHRRARLHRLAHPRRPGGAVAARHGLQGLAGRDHGDRRQLRHQRRAAARATWSCRCRSTCSTRRARSASQTFAPTSMRAARHAGGGQRGGAGRPLDLARRRRWRRSTAPANDAEIAAMQRAGRRGARRPARSACRPAPSIRRRRPRPPRRSSRSAGRSRARAALYVTHMRDEVDRVMESLDETFRIGRELDMPVVVSHHKVQNARQLRPLAGDAALHPRER